MQDAKDQHMTNGATPKKRGAGTQAAPVPAQAPTQQQAAANPDRRVQVAALRTLLGFQPQTSFTGSSAVADGLFHLVGATGKRQALIVHPRLDLAQHLAGELATLGIDGIPATNGRQAMALLQTHPDIESIVVHMAIARPTIDDFLDQLRRDWRTSGLPIAVLALPDGELAAECLIQRIGREESAVAAPWSQGRVPLSVHGRQRPLVLPRPALPLVEKTASDALTLRYLMEQLDRRADRSRTTPERRQADARWALETLAVLTPPERTLFDLRGHATQLELALERPELAALAPQVLARVPTTRAQQLLCSQASQPGHPLELRRSAAAALAESVVRFGMLLRAQDIQHQYQRYNASAEQEPAEQQVLAAVLDALERKRPAP